MTKLKLFIACVVLFIVVGFTRTNNLDQPSQFLFDEDLYIYTAQLIANGDKKAFEWWHPPDTTAQSPYYYRPPAVEWLHPPISKYFQTLSISSIGNNPLGWRLPSAMAGVLLIGAIGWLAHALFQRWSITILAMGLASLEHLIYVQSRLASADIFVALFSTAALASFVQWQQRGWRYGLPLAGVLAGLAIASKWSGGLIILAMVVLLAVDHLRKTSNELTLTKSNYREGSNQTLKQVMLIRQRRIQHLPPQLTNLSSKKNSTTINRPFNITVSSKSQANHKWKTLNHVQGDKLEFKQLVIRLLTITLIPLAIYVVTYLPAIALGHTPAHIVELHQQAWNYHSTNRAAHPNSSPAFFWLLNQKPVWYYFNEASGQSIKAQGTALIIWGGLVAVILSLLSIILANRPSSRSKDRPNIQSLLRRIFSLSNSDQQSLLVLVITFFVLWLPWLFVQRPTYLYHFLPCIPILIIFLSFWLVVIPDSIRNFRITSKRVILN